MVKRRMSEGANREELSPYTIYVACLSVSANVSVVSNRLN